MYVQPVDIEKLQGPKRKGADTVDEGENKKKKKKKSSSKM
jgi:hypothetical protein